MSDLLAAAGLLLAIVTMLYSLWYREMEDAAATTAPEHPEDRIGPYKEVRKTWSNEAMPLVLAAWVLTIVLAPDAVSVCLGAARCLWRAGPQGVLEYNAVKTAYVLVTIGAAFMAVRATTISRRMRNTIKALRAEPPQVGG